MLRSVNKAMMAVARSMTTAAGRARSWQALAMVDACHRRRTPWWWVGGGHAGSE